MSRSNYKNQVIAQLKTLLGDPKDIVEYDTSTYKDLDFVLLSFEAEPLRYYTAGISDSLYDSVEISLEHQDWTPGLQDVFAYIATYIAVKNIHVFNGVNISNLEVSTIEFDHPEIAGCVFKRHKLSDVDLEVNVSTASGSRRSIPIYETVLMNKDQTHEISNGNNPYLDNDDEY